MKCLPLLAALSLAFIPAVRAAFLIFPEGEAGLEGDTKAAFEAYKRGEKNKAVTLFKAEANRGEKNAQYALATLYQEGKEVEQSMAMAENWYRKAAVQGQTAAQFNLGLMMLKSAKTAEGLEFMKKAAAGGMSKASLLLGGMYLEGNGALPRNVAEAHRYLKEAATLGEAEAYQVLARLYEAGEGVNKDDKLALEYFNKAAEGGSVEALLRLAARYLDGTGVAKDAAQSVAFLQKASDLKSSRAQLVLGQLYESGTGVEKNAEEAYSWYKKAAEGGDAEGIMRVASMQSEGRGVAKDEKSALEWLRKAAEGGYSPAMYAVSTATEKGKGTAANADEGRKWLMKSALSGFPVAQRDLASRYRKGEGMPADTVAAMSWFDRAMRGGDAAAALSLSEMLLTGEGGLPPNPQEAKNILSQASELGIADAQVKLAEIYEKGLNGRPDLIRAYAILMASADTFEPAKKKLEELTKTMPKDQVELAKKEYERMRVKPSERPENKETPSGGAPAAPAPAKANP